MGVAERVGVVGEGISSVGKELGVEVGVEVGEGETSVGRKGVAVGRAAAPAAVGVAGTAGTPA
jgi:hypothetical protein